jgi:phosphatidate cytidylyltransferase
MAKLSEANRNLLIRIGTAVVLAPPLVALILWERAEPTAVVVHCAVLVALLEFYWIALPQDPPWVRVVGALIGLAISVAWFWLPGRPDLLLALLIFSTMTATTLQLVIFRDIADAARAAATMVFGLLYVPLLLTPLALLKRFVDGGDWVLLVLMVAFFSDTGAYAAGRAFGRHRLYPAVSPGKTVEGALGGLVASFAAAAMAKLWFMPQLGWLDALLVAVPGGALGQIGDLVESMIKRAFAVKDSGRIIPGHGGLLDRVDALLFCGAYVYLYARYVFFA